MEIREAVADDAEEACNVMRRSIRELCAADHGDDPAILARWLANKTPENVAVWIARPDASLLVAVESGAIGAVGMVTDAGEILLRLARREIPRRQPSASRRARGGGARRPPVPSREHRERASLLPHRRLR